MGATRVDSKAALLAPLMAAWMVLMTAALLAAAMALTTVGGWVVKKALTMAA